MKNDPVLKELEELRIEVAYLKAGIAQIMALQMSLVVHLEKQLKARGAKKREILDTAEVFREFAMDALKPPPRGRPGSRR